jgi:hypothetical protein
MARIACLRSHAGDRASPGSTSLPNLVAGGADSRRVPFLVIDTDAGPSSERVQRSPHAASTSGCATERVSEVTAALLASEVEPR